MKKANFNMEFARKYGILFVLVAMWAILLAVSPTFRTTTNAVNILRQVSVNGILALAMTFVIMTGGIDLTVGSLVAVVGVVTGSMLVANPENVAGAIIAGIVICMLFGAMNGFFIAYMGVPPFVATLAGQTIARGFAYVYSDGKPYTLASDGFRFIGKGMAPIVIFIVLLVLCHIVLSKMKFGRYIYAVVAGIVLASRTNSGQPAVGVGYETDAIAAAVIGGTSMTGGIGTIPGTLVGILIIGTLNNGMNLLDVSSYWQQIVKGIIILGAVCFDIVSKKLSK